MLIINFFRKHYPLLAILTIVSFIAAISESLGLSLLFPLFGSFEAGANEAYSFPFSYIAKFFANMSVVKKFQVVALALFLITIIKSFMLYLSNILSARMQVEAIKYSKTKCMSQLMDTGMNYYNRQKASDMFLIVDSYSVSVIGAIISLVSKSITLGLQIVLLIFLIFALSWKLSLFSLVVVVAASLVLSKLSQRILIAGKEVIDTRNSFGKVLLDVISGMKLIRLFNRQDYMKEKFNQQVDLSNEAIYKTEKLAALASPLFESVGVGVLALILFFGSFMLIKAEASWAAILLTFVIIVSRLINPIKTVNNFKAQIISKMHGLKEIEKFLSSTDKQPLLDGDKEFKGLTEGIEFKSAGFQYNPGSFWVLKDFSCFIAKGSKVGLVGSSGAGKSTITDLILRFYDLQAGAIIIDGVNLCDFKISSWRKHIGVVTQETFLFYDTLLVNITFGRKDISFDQVKTACQRAHIYDFIMSLPDKFETLVGDRGVLLSGGQRQRIAIARAILLEPDILILDEATSALDTESEQIVQKALDEISAGKTVITIAHRVSTLAKSDVIFALEEGRVIEQGNHQELMTKDGVYKKFVSMQKLQA